MITVKDIYLHDDDFNTEPEFPLNAFLVTHYSDGHISIKPYYIYACGGVCPLQSAIRVSVDEFYGFTNHKLPACSSSPLKYQNDFLMREFADYCFQRGFKLCPH